MAVTLESAFENLRAAFNTALVTTDEQNPKSLSNMISNTPKHPEHVEEDDEFPYACMIYSGEKPEYEGSDMLWIQPSREMAAIQMWLAVAPSESDALSVDLMKLVKVVRDVVKATTRKAQSNGFRVRVDSVETEYEPSGRWGLAVVTVTIGAYD